MIACRHQSATCFWYGKASVCERSISAITVKTASLPLATGTLRQKYPLAEGRAPAHIRGALTSYFEGEITAIDRVPVETNGTPFQRQVWAALREIPAGTTTSYGALAARIGNPNASRAVGLANGSNPIGIVVPCHRVIGASGKLTGYGGGLDRKRWLLEHERGALFVTESPERQVDAQRPASR